jgi:hypothetical protein
MGRTLGWDDIQAHLSGRTAMSSMGPRALRFRAGDREVDVEIVAGDGEGALDCAQVKVVVCYEHQLAHATALRVNSVLRAGCLGLDEDVYQLRQLLPLDTAGLPDLDRSIAYLSQVAVAVRATLTAPPAWRVGLFAEYSL